MSASAPVLNVSVPFHALGRWCENWVVNGWMRKWCADEDDNDVSSWRCCFLVSIFFVFCVLVSCAFLFLWGKIAWSRWWWCYAIEKKPMTMAAAFISTTSHHWLRSVNIDSIMICTFASTTDFIDLPTLYKLTVIVFFFLSRRSFWDLFSNHHEKKKFASFHWPKSKSSFTTEAYKIFFSSACAGWKKKLTHSNSAIILP